MLDYRSLGESTEVGGTIGWNLHSSATLCGNLTSMASGARYRSRSTSDWPVLSPSPLDSSTRLQGGKYMTTYPPLTLIYSLKSDIRSRG